MRSLVRSSSRFLMALAIIMIACMIVPSQAAAQAVTQGDVALALARELALTANNADEAIAALTAIGIAPAGGWDAGAPATPNTVGSLYTSVNSAINAGTVSPPAALGNASALVAAAATFAGMPSSAVVNAITNAGGDSASATQGASYGSSGGVAGPGAPSGPATTTTVSPTPTGPSGGAAGGGGGTSSPSS
jgi:hypothetical protein